jgi:intein/homing endonuclease
VSIGNYKWDRFFEKAEKFIGHINEKPESNCKQVGLTGLSDEARRILKSVGKHAKEKVLPVEIISLNKELSKAFLDGYESGDGCEVNGKKFYTSSSRSLLLGMAIVAQKVYGRVCAVYPGRGERTGNIRGRQIHCSQEWNMVLSPRYSFSFEDKNHITWKKVKKVESAKNADVWSIEVEEDHTYMAEGVIVKNCPLQLPVIERLVKLYTNPNDIVFTPFMGIGSEVYQSVKMGRKAIGIELKKEYFLQAKKNLQALDDESKQMTFEDYFNLKV